MAPPAPPLNPGLDTTRGFRAAEIHLVFWGDGNDESHILRQRGRDENGVGRSHRNHELSYPAAALRVCKTK